MMGIDVIGPTNCFCNKKSVVTNSVVPQSTINKNHKYVAYHKVKESVAFEAVSNSSWKIWLMHLHNFYKKAISKSEFNTF
jgi:hypothetical protein